MVAFRMATEQAQQKEIWRSRNALTGLSDRVVLLTQNCSKKSSTQLCLDIYVAGAGFKKEEGRGRFETTDHLIAIPASAYYNVLRICALSPNLLIDRSVQHFIQQPFEFFAPLAEKTPECLHSPSS